MCPARSRSRSRSRSWSWGLAVLLSACGAVSPQTLPQSPCPSVFQYQTDGQQWTGLLQVTSPPLGSTLRLNLKMSIGVQLPTRYVGQLELLGGQSELLQQMLRGGLLRYRVHFPLFSPLPQVTAITFNGNLICQGPPVRYGYVTTINLDHTLATGNRQNSARPGYNGAGAGMGARPGDGVVVIIEEDEEPSSYSPPRNPYGGNNPIAIDAGSGTASYNNQTVELRPAGPGQNYWVVYKDRPSPEDFARPVKLEPGQVTTAQPRPDQVTPVQSRPGQVAPGQSGPGQPGPGQVWPGQGGQNNELDEKSPERTQESCGVTGQLSNPLIVGGEATSRGDWPWIAAIFVKKVSSLEFICAGTLVSARHIVTAAHCVHSKGNRAVKVNELLVKVGVFNLQDWTDENVRTLAVAQVFLHPDFNGTQVLNTDIAVLVVSKSVTFTQFISIACLWEGDSNLNNIVGQKGVVVGWGRDENGLKATPEPRRADITIVSTDTCRASRQEFQVLTNDKTLCAGDRDGSGPCNGDSGGGLFLYRGGRWTLRGVVSNSLSDPESTNTCNLHEFVIFTDTAKYLTWVKSVLATS